MNSNTVSGEASFDLLTRTLRAVFLMVLACVVFVGAVSLAAVAVASHAAHPADAHGSLQTDTGKPPAIAPRDGVHAGRTHTVTPASRI